MQNERAPKAAVLQSAFCNLRSARGALLRSRLLFGLVLFALGARPAAAQAPPGPSFEGREIRVIELDVPAGVDVGRLREVIKLREGDSFSQESARAAVAALYGLGEFDKIAFEPIPVERGLRLVFHIKVRPKVHAIRLEGDLGLSEDTILGLFQARTGSPAAPYTLKADREALRARYLDSGYLFADIRQETRDAEGGVDVVYHIEAGPKLNLECVRFEGNTDIPDDEILPAMLSVKSGGLFTHGKYDPALLRSDLLAVRELFRRRGYLDATVGHEILFDEGKERAWLVVRILEGPLYRISRLTIRGAQVIPAAQVLDAIKLREGEALAQEQLEKDLEALRSLYGRIGCIKADVRVERVFSENEPLVALTLTVREGEKYYVNKVIIRGNLKTQDHVVRREVALLPGAVANSAAIEETKRRLANLGYFSFSEPGEKGEAVRVRFVDVLPPEKPDMAEPNVTDVLIEVTEGSMGSISVGAGYSSSLGLIGNIRLTHRNFDATAFPRSWRELFHGEAFTGDGQQFTISVTPGTTWSDYRLTWLNPSVADSPYSVGFDLYLRDFGWTDFYNERRTGASVIIGRRFFKDLNVSLSPRVEQVRISNLDTTAPADAVAVKGTHDRRALTLSADYDRRDNVFFTTSGYRLGGTLEMAGTVLGGSVNTLRETFEARKWWTVWDAPGWGKHTLTLGGQAGFLNSTDAGAAPIFDRFFTGGLGSIRGFEYRRVGPVDAVTLKQIGGEYMFLLNGEYEVPIVKDYFRGLVFVDTGSLSSSFADWGEVRASAGVGVRLRLPVFGLQRIPISLYLATPFIRKSTDKEEMFSFTVGTGFEF